jgi:hypothetical protein
MACTEAAAMQEVNYIRALQSAERYVLQGAALLIHVRGCRARSDSSRGAERLRHSPEGESHATGSSDLPP